MAPLAALPRRGRKKSQNACWSCRRRRVRCDKNLPKCRNCISQACDCDYAVMNRSGVRKSSDQGSKIDAEDDADDADVQAEEDATVEGVVVSDHSSLPSDETVEKGSIMAPKAAPSFYALPVTQHQLLYHMSSISTSIEGAQTSNIVIYMKELPTLLTVAFSYDFVMHSLMAWAASHLAFSTHSLEASILAHQYRLLSMQGLQGAISTFNEKNSDAVLSASLLLSWQAPDPREWATMNKGTSAVISAMQTWRHSSLFAKYIEDDALYTRSPNAVQRPVNFLSDTDEAAALRYIHEALQRVEQYARGRSEEIRILHDLMAFVENVERHLPVVDPIVRFYLCEPTRSMLFWYPTRLCREARRDPIVMVVLAHLYAVSLTVQPVFAGQGSAHFRGLSVTPIENIYHVLVEMHKQSGGTMDSFVPLSLMHFPMQAVSLFRSRMGLDHSVLRADQSLTAIQYGLDPLADASSPIFEVED